MNHLFAALLAACLALPAAAAEAEDTTLSDEAPGLTARYLLMDANGRAVTNEDFPGRFQLVSFGYTFCPDVCPTTLAEIAAIIEQLGAEAERLQPLFITLDPERDSAAVLQGYTRFFHPRIVGLTGSPELVRRAAENFKVRYEKVREPGTPAAQYAVDHSAGLYLLGPDGRFLKKFAYATPADEIAASIGELMKNPDPHTPARRPRAYGR